MHQIIDEEKQLQAILVGLQTRQSDEAFDRAMAEYGPDATVIAMPFGGSTLPIAE